MRRVKGGLMLFSVGQNIVHPAHGAGTIVALQEQELVKGFRRYYVVRFADKRLTIRIPLRRTDELGVRKVMGQATCDKVLAVLRDLPHQLPSNFKERRKTVEKMIHSGRPVKIAEALRELTWRREVKRLNKADSELYSQAQDMLTQEMTLATGHDLEDVQRQINYALQEAVDAKLAAIEMAEEVD